MSASQRQIVYHVLLRHHHKHAVLHEQHEHGWTLPYWIDNELRFWQSVEHINRALHTMLNVPAVTLRCVETHRDAESNTVQRVYEAWVSAADWTPPPQAQWIAPDTCRTLPLALPEQRPWLRAWANEAQQGVPPQRRPWARPPWFAAMERWIASQLQDVALTQTGPLAQVRTWERSCVLRVPTTGGAVYAKAVPAIFAHEPRLTRLLATLQPTMVHTPLAVNEAQGWLLMPKWDGQPLDHGHAVEQWESTIAAFARFQRALAAHTAELRATGCPYRPLDLLATQIEPLLWDDTALVPEQPPMLSADTIALLRAQSSRLRAMCAELAEFHIPPSLEHGDLWPSNIIVGSTNVWFTDWSDSAIAHPFFSLILFLEDAAQALPHVPDLRDRLLHAYLQPWTIYEPIERLRSAFDLAQMLAPIHYAVTYHQYVLPHMEARWEMHNMVPFYLQLAAERMAA